MYTNNVMAGGSPSSYSDYPGNFFPNSDNDVGFVNLAGGDYHLSASSPYKNAGTDGKDIGADIDAVNSATAGALNGSSSVESVIWTDLVNVTVTSNSLQKTAGCDGCQDAGAASTQQTTSGNGYVEFTASETTTTRGLGLSNGNPGTSGAEIDFGILLGTTGSAVYESGAWKIELGTYVPGDIFRVAVEEGVAKYYKNGALGYTSSTTPTYPLLVDTTLWTLNATISNVIISRGP